MAESLLSCLNGLLQDVITSCLLLVVPSVLVLIAKRWTSIPLKAILTPYYIIIGFCVALVLTADMVMYEFWQFKLGAVVLSYAASPEGVSSSVSIWFILVRVLYFLMLMLLLVVSSIRLTPRRGQRHLPNGLPAAAILVVSLVSLPLSSVGNVYHSDKLFANHAAVNPFYNFFYTANLGKSYHQRYDYFDEEQRAELFEGLYPSDTEDVTDTLLQVKKPNILLVYMESFGSEFIEEMGGAKDVAPNWSKIIKEGIFWSNYYSNSFRTDRATVSTLCGNLSYADIGLMSHPEMHAGLASMVRSLNKAGYETSYLYPGPLTNMGKGTFLKNVNFKNIYGSDIFTAEELCSSWGSNDSIGARKTLEIIGKQSSEKPWLMMFQTLSSHEPWEVPYQRMEDKVLNAFAYADYSLGILIDSLKTMPQWENTLVIVIPDHGHLYHQSYQDPEYFHAPMAWTGGAVKGAKSVDVLMNQSDIAATLLSQLGISHAEFNWSRNVLSRNYTRPFVYSIFPAGILYKDAEGTTIFDITADKVIYDNGSSDMEQRTNRAKAILQTSYDRL